MKACASVSAGYKGPFVEASMDAEGCKESKSSSKSGDKKKTDSTKVISIGSKPYKNGAGKKRLPLCHAILTTTVLNATQGRLEMKFGSIASSLPLEFKVEPSDWPN